MRPTHGARASSQPTAAAACHAIVSGAMSATMRITATACNAAKANHATFGITSGRPEWPCVTRVTIATSRLPKKPMNKACIGARPRMKSPLAR